MKKISFLGLNLIDATPKAIINYFTNRIESKNKCFVITLNSIMLFHYFIDRKFKKIVKQADLIIVDGFGISFIAKWFGVSINSIPGIELLNKVFLMANRKQFSVFLLGSRWKIIEMAYKNLKNNFPNIKYNGRYYGYFNKTEEKYIIRKIKQLKPDILLIGMGSVKQEKWIYKNFDDLNAYLIIGVGGSFDIISGHKKRAPLWMRKCHLEWLYRSITSPRRFINLFKISLLLIIIILLKIRKSIS